MQVIETKNAPAAIGPYSQAVKVGDMVYTSGQIALTPDGELNGGDVQEQTRQVLTNLKAVLEAGGSGLDKVLKTTIYLTDMNNFVAVNEVYAEFFTGSFPARSTVAVKSLPKGVDVEIDAIAYAKKDYSF